MPVGPSGRIVIEIDPGLKRDLYGALGVDQVSLRDWFLEHVQTYLNSHGQLRLQLTADDEPRRKGNDDALPTR
jgi:hypothetical protein